MFYFLIFRDPVACCRINTLISFTYFVSMAPAAEKAVKAAKAARVGVSKKKVAIRTKAHFYKPQTKLGGHQVAQYLKVLPSGRGIKMDNYAIVKRPLTTESAMKKIEDNNTLVFLVEVKANKKQIKNAVEKVSHLGGGLGMGAARLAQTPRTAANFACARLLARRQILRARQPCSPWARAPQRQLNPLHSLRPRAPHPPARAAL